MSTFFKATQTAAGALYGDFKLKPYYNVWFHLDALTTFACHILRALYNLACVAFHLLITPLCILNPLAWLGLPAHFINLADDMVGFGLSLVPIVIHPLIVAIRTLSSMIFGYEDNHNNSTGLESEEKADCTLAMAIW